MFAEYSLEKHIRTIHYKMCYLIVVLTRPGLLQAELDYTYGNYIMSIRIHITLFCCQGIFVQCVYVTGFAKGVLYVQLQIFRNTGLKY